jgi:hypothetical protein
MRRRGAGNAPRLPGWAGGHHGQMDRHAQSVKHSPDDTANGLAAMAGEVDDKIDRALAQTTTEERKPR